MISQAGDGVPPLPDQGRLGDEVKAYSVRNHENLPKMNHEKLPLDREG